MGQTATVNDNYPCPSSRGLVVEVRAEWVDDAGGEWVEVARNGEVWCCRPEELDR